MKCSWKWRCECSVIKAKPAHRHRGRGQGKANGQIEWERSSMRHPITPTITQLGRCTFTCYQPHRQRRSHQFHFLSMARPASQPASQPRKQHNHIPETSAAKSTRNAEFGPGSRNPPLPNKVVGTTDDGTAIKNGKKKVTHLGAPDHTIFSAGLRLARGDSEYVCCAL